MALFHRNVRWTLGALLSLAISCTHAGPSADVTAPVDSTGAEFAARGDGVERRLGPDDVVDLVSVDSREQLERLRPLFEDARVVLLGEADHGDGAAITAKAALARYLHQDLGFEVLALESGLYDCEQAWQLARRGASADKVADACAFSIWRETKPMRELWEYVVEQADSESPFIVAGFDNQFSGGGPNFVTELVAALEEHGALDSLPRSWRDEFESVITKLRIMPPTDRAPQERERGRAAIAAALDAMRSSEAADEGAVSRWIRLLEGLVALEASHWLYREGGPEVADEDTNLRDEQMARNLIWLLTERYPDKRFVVWSATMHNIWNPTLIAGELDHGEHVHDFDELRPMGDMLVAELPSLNVVSIAFVGLQGDRGWPSGRTVGLPQPPADSFESAALATGIDYGLIDLRQYVGSEHWLARPFSAGLLGQQLEAPWAQVVDAISFIRTMTPNYGGDD